MFFFVNAVLAQITLVYLRSSSVPLSYFILAVCMRECLEKSSCMSSTFPIAILNGTYFFPTVQVQVHNKCLWYEK